ncbi:MAG TPA: NPCBM/NEW2 domain-containing protein [Verrucomicrobiae bacterium]|nr:NPCBM/NEW2 domain-containing protein [Verrucomicrobiae bacterium]
MKSLKWLGFAFLVVMASIAAGSAKAIWLDELDLSVAAQGWGDPHKNQSVDGHALTIGGEKFDRGFGTHAESILNIKLDGGAQNFSASVGVDSEVTNRVASVEFLAVGDGKILWQSGVMHAGDAAKHCDVNLANVKNLTLKVSDAGDGISYDHADWADAKFEMLENQSVSVVSDEPALVAPYILTPPAPTTPRINGANIFGVRLGSPFLFTIAATGDRPMTFSAKHLPRGLKLNSQTGHITGTLKVKGEYVVTLRAKNVLGEAEKKFRIICGDQIALTPPMGWNSWNCFAGAVSEEKVKSAADAMVKSGLINHGWTYINVDDYWQNHRDSSDPTLRGPFRDAQGNVVPNSRFPDMKGMADYIHNLGLKAGLYSSPGPWTCGGCTGSWQHEQQDAAQYAAWGFDYLKYDWCSYGEIASGGDPNAKDIPLWGKTATNDAGAIFPYKVMGAYLREQKRDIVFSLCQYGMADVWQWGGSVNGNCWRTTGDITDTWRSMSDIGFNQDKAAPYAKPGNWNDPDMLIVGEVGWGNLHPTRLSPDEQYTHISLWCLLSAPLLIGCDMTQLDAFTLNLLENDEVLAIDQDALGKEATCVIHDNDLRVYEKELEDGGLAIGFFNLGREPMKLDFKQFAQLGLSGKQHVRDLWRQQDLPDVEATSGDIQLNVPAHGVELYKFTSAK